MANIIITGATGMAGSAALTMALASPLVSHVTVLSRRAPNITHEKLTTIITPSADHPQGFDSLSPELIQKLKGNSAVIWALGISQTKVSKDEYIRITYDYPAEAARAFASLGTPDEPFRFVFISGHGATQDESSYTLFGKFKGRAEKLLASLETPSFRAINLRPAGIKPAPDHQPGQAWYMTTAVSVLSYVMPSITIDARDLGLAAVELAAGTRGWDERDKDQYFINNTQLKRMAEVYKREMGA